jgi:hypothetical protein
MEILNKNSNTPIIPYVKKISKRSISIDLMITVLYSLYPSPKINSKREYLAMKISKASKRNKFREERIKVKRSYLSKKYVNLMNKGLFNIICQIMILMITKKTTKIICFLSF